MLWSCQTSLMEWLSVGTKNLIYSQLQTLLVQSYETTQNLAVLGKVFRISRSGGGEGEEEGVWRKGCCVQATKCCASSGWAALLKHWGRVAYSFFASLESDGGICSICSSVSFVARFTALPLVLTRQVAIQ